MDDILDDFSENKNLRSQVDKFVIKASLGMAILYLLIYFTIGKYIPENLFVYDEIEIKTYGLLILILNIAIILWSVKSIIKIDSTKKPIVIAILTGAIIFFSDFLFKVVLNLILLENYSDVYILPLIVGSMFLSVLGLLLGFDRAKKLKNENRLISRLLLIGYFILIGVLGNMDIL